MMKTDPIQTRPYAPSFIDGFMGFVKRVPFSYWLTYLLLFILENLMVYALAWIFGWLPAFTVLPILFSFPLWLWGPLALMTHLNRVALEALTSFSPLLDADEESLERLKVEFTVMPARNVILSGVLWSIIYLILIFPGFRGSFADYGIGTAFSRVIIIEGLISFAFGSAIFYHSFRQLRLVNRTVRMVRQFDLFRLNPVYSFSRVTSQIGVAWMVLLSLTLLLFPIKLASVPLLAVLATQVVLAVAAFVLPLLFVNRRLVLEKRRLLAEHNLRVAANLERLHRCLDEKKMDEMAQLNNAMQGLNVERNILTSIPTWPWRTNTLTTFLSALGLPMIVFLIQLLIKKLLGI
jgi:hypothetical protein